VGLIKTAVTFNRTVAVQVVAVQVQLVCLLVLLLGVWLLKETTVATELMLLTVQQPVAVAVAGLVLLVLLAHL
jgi:hypothetical protein